MRILDCRFRFDSSFRRSRLGQVPKIGTRSPVSGDQMWLARTAIAPETGIQWAVARSPDSGFAGMTYLQH